MWLDYSIRSCCTLNVIFNTVSRFILCIIAHANTVKRNRKLKITLQPSWILQWWQKSRGKSRGSKGDAKCCRESDPSHGAALAVYSTASANCQLDLTALTPTTVGVRHANNVSNTSASCISRSIWTDKKLQGFSPSHGEHSNAVGQGIVLFLVEHKG